MVRTISTLNSFSLIFICSPSNLISIFPSGVARVTKLQRPNFNFKGKNRKNNTKKGKFIIFSLGIWPKCPALAKPLNQVQKVYFMFFSTLLSDRNLYHDRSFLLGQSLFDLWLSTTNLRFSRLLCRYRYRHFNYNVNYNFTWHLRLEF